MKYFMCEDRNRTDPPEMDYFNRFIDDVLDCDPEDPKAFREALTDYPPMTDAEIERAKAEALEHRQKVEALAEEMIIKQRLRNNVRYRD